MDEEGDVVAHGVVVGVEVCRWFYLLDLPPCPTCLSSKLIKRPFSRDSNSFVCIIAVRCELSLFPFQIQVRTN